MEKNKYRILVVDDEEQTRFLYRIFLESSASGKASKPVDDIAFELFDDHEGFPAADLKGAEVDLESANYEVDYFPQGTDAVNAVQQAIQEERPYSLAFLDMHMPPGINGKETAKRIRFLDNLVELVIMTADRTSSYKAIADEIGSTDRLLYFQKPFTQEQIQQLATSLTQKWEIEKTFPQKPKKPSSRATQLPFDLDRLRGELEKAPHSKAILKIWNQRIEELDLFLKDKGDQIYEQKLDLSNSHLLKINHLRKALRFYPIPWIERVTALPQKDLDLHTSRMSYFHSAENFFMLLDHLYRESP